MLGEYRERLRKCIPKLHFRSLLCANIFVMFACESNLFTRNRLFDIEIENNINPSPA